MPVTFNLTILHCRNHLHLMAAMPRCRSPQPRVLSIGTYNIRNVNGFGIAQAIWAVQVGGFNLMVLTETKVTGQAYFHNRLGYNVVFLSEINTDAGGAQGVLSLFVQDRPKGCIVELTRFHMPDVVIYEIFAGRKMIPVIDAYLPASTLEHLQELEEALPRFQYQDPIVLGDLKTNIVKYQNPGSQQVFLIILLGRPSCPNGIQIVGRWCSTPFTGPKRH